MIRSAGTEGHYLVPSRAPKAPSQAGWPSAHALGGCGRQRDLHTPPEHLAAPFWEVKALTHTQPRDSLATVTLKATFAPRCFQGELLPQGQ